MACSETERFDHFDLVQLGPFLHSVVVSISSYPFITYLYTLGFCLVFSRFHQVL